jgi:DNA-binding CsgD family transcriptional regulator
MRVWCHHGLWPTRRVRGFSRCFLNRMIIVSAYMRVEEQGLPNDEVRPASNGSMLNSLNRIAECNSLAELASVVFRVADELLLSATAGGMLTGPKAATSDLFYFNNWPSTWLDVYRTKLIDGQDPIVRWALGSGAPITWLDLKAKLIPGDPGRKLFELAAANGFVEGFALPVRTTAGHLGLVSWGGDRPALSLDEQSLLQVVGTAALNHAEALTEDQSGHVIKVMTRRERDCVALLVKGLSEPDIAAALGISPVTARFHLDNARIKMRASSRAHLADIMTGLMHKF